MKTKRNTIITVLFFLLFSLGLVIKPCAESWSIKRQTEHKQPITESKFNYISNYNGYYIDKKVSDADKVIYLTFDAGYENGNIQKILDTMKKHEVKSAFFVLDNLIINNTELIKQMNKDGHLVCNHTAKHKDMTKVTDINSFKEELDKLNNVYSEYIGGEMPKFYRPPEGKFTEQNLDFANKLGYKTIFWSFAYADWDNNKQPNEDWAINKILDNTHNGMVILLHPTSATNANILDRLLTEWKSQGYRFGTLDELTSKQQ